jgi:hypothetical protein
MNHPFDAKYPFGYPFGVKDDSAAPLLLETYSGAAAAYSTRKLRAAYNGPALKLRRSSDNVEADFSFAGDWVDSAAITTWLGGANGHIVTWYDQSGNSRNLIQAAALSQPIFDASGIGALPALSFLTNSLAAAFTTVAQPLTEFYVFQATSIVAAGALSDSYPAGTVCRTEVGTASYNIGAGANLTGGTPDTDAHQLTTLKKGATSVIREDGAGIASGNAGTQSLLSGLTLGVRTGGTNPLTGLIGEYILFGSDMTASFAGIEADQQAAWETP